MEKPVIRLDLENYAEANPINIISQTVKLAERIGWSKNKIEALKEKYHSARLREDFLNVLHENFEVI